MEEAITLTTSKLNGARRIDQAGAMNYAGC
jgi:hypothetical protein